MVMELLRKMLEVTMTRGAQSAGLVTYRQAGGDAQGCRARTVSGKRTDLARLVLSKFSRVIERRRPLLGAGLIAAPQLFQGHTRFATTSLTTLGGCHPHQWCPPSKQKHWSWADGGGGYVARQRTVEGFITHNGDLDYFSIHGVGYPVHDHPYPNPYPYPNLTRSRRRLQPDDDGDGDQAQVWIRQGEPLLHA